LQWLFEALRTQCALLKSSRTALVKKKRPPVVINEILWTIIIETPEKAKEKATRDGTGTNL